MIRLLHKNKLKNLADKIKYGELIAVPTETVYGLAGNGLDEAAVKKIYDLKGRPEIKPLSIMVHDSSWIDRFCFDVPDVAYFLADKYWPGPLSIVLKSLPVVPEIVRAGGSTVSLRCPDNQLTLNLIEESDLPLAAPSANPSGMPSPKSADEVKNYFGDSIEIIDGGKCSLGIESTIIDLSCSPYKVLRAGALSEEELFESFVDYLYIVGLTGQTGAGKSEVLNIFSEKNYLVIDCDKVYHDLLLSDKEMLSDLEFIFPEAFFDGNLDRKALASIVFKNKQDLIRLNNITHTYVCRKVKSILKDYVLNGGKFAVIEAIELISSGLGELCDKKIALVASEDVRLDRIIKRDNLSYEEALLRVRSQKDEKYYLSNCDVVIDNSDTLEVLKNKINDEVFANE